MADATRIQIPAALGQRMDAAIARYPSEHRRSAAMPLLHLWQEHFGFIGDEAIFWIAEKLGLQPINISRGSHFLPNVPPASGRENAHQDLPYPELRDGGLEWK